MAVSSANRSGSPPATTADEAIEQLGESVSIYLDGGPSGAPLPSTIVDVTGSVVRVLRVGDIPVDALRELVPDIEAPAHSE
jgi:tRNA A37 threonylcarbamoyladenosine synthetase subunit TsaC/SUA5/YrdC